MSINSEIERIRGNIAASYAVAEEKGATMPAEQNSANLAETLASMNYIPTSQKGTAGGVASLDSSGKVPESQLPSMDYIPNNAKGAAGGVASLGTDGKVPTTQLPQMNYIPTSEKGAEGGVAPMYTYGTTEMTAGTTELETGKIYLQYE